MNNLTISECFIWPGNAGALAYMRRESKTGILGLIYKDTKEPAFGFQSCIP